jgi:hypothetical protein
MAAEQETPSLYYLIEPAMERRLGLLAAKEDQFRDRSDIQLVCLLALSLPSEGCSVDAENPPSNLVGILLREPGGGANQSRVLDYTYVCLFLLSSMQISGKFVDGSKAPAMDQTLSKAAGIPQMNSRHESGASCRIFGLQDAPD